MVQRGNLWEPGEAGLARHRLKAHQHLSALTMPTTNCGALVLTIFLGSAHARYWKAVRVHPLTIELAICRERRSTRGNNIMAPLRKATPERLVAFSTASTPNCLPVL